MIEIPISIRGGNRKLGNVATESRPTGPTCPLSCAHHPDRGGDCYSARADRRHPSVLAGMRHRASVEIEQSARYWADRSRMWAQWADQGIPLRALVHGDLLDPKTGRIDSRWVFNLVRSVRESGIRAWLYTHAWRMLSPRHLAVFRSAPRLRLFASCDTVEAAKEAVRRGFRVALVSEDQGEWKTLSESIGQPLIPCPNQTHGITCADCRYCFAPGAAGGVIFKPH